MFINSTSPFITKIDQPLTKSKITTLQINLGRKCNLACTHCHVEASPKRTEELATDICQVLIEIIEKFPQITTVDLTGGAPEMNYGFRPLVDCARKFNKSVIVRSNLTIYFEDNYQDLPKYCADRQVRIVASLPCYLEKNVDKMRGSGVFDYSIKALQILNDLGYGINPNLPLDLVYNPPIPQEGKFTLPPEQKGLEQDYKKHLETTYNIKFNQLLTITNLPIGRTKQYLDRYDLMDKYINFLADNFNLNTVSGLMCKNQLSIDYLGNVYDCDFNQMANLPALNHQGEKVTVNQLLALENLDLIQQIQTADYCYGCTAGAGSSCGGAIV